MNITDKDRDVLKAVKKIVEQIEKAGKLPTDRETNQKMLDVWNMAYKKNDKLSNCPSCKQRRFLQLKRTYDLFELKGQFNRKAPAKKQQGNSTKGTKTAGTKKRATAKKK